MQHDGFWGGSGEMSGLLFGMALCDGDGAEEGTMVLPC